MNLPPEDSEKEFFNRSYEGGLNEAYEDLVIDNPRELSDVVDEPWTYFFSIIGNLKGKKVLDLGCGIGLLSIALAINEAQVTAIDISEIGISITNKRAKANNFQDRILAKCMSAYNIQCQDGYFDLVVGNGILHHLEMEEIIPEIKRVLKPNGYLCFVEPVIPNRFNRTIKNMLVKLFKIKKQDLTEDEEPLSKEEVNYIKSNFKIISCQGFYFLSKINQLLDKIFENKSKHFPIFSLIDRFCYKHIKFTRSFFWGISILGRKK